MSTLTPTFFKFRSIAEAYEKLVPYVLENGIETISERGKTKYLPYVLVEITNPNLTRISSKYPLGKKAVDDYTDKLINGYDKHQDFVYTYHERLCSYGCNAINQLDYIVNKLKEFPETRRAVASLWCPCKDTFHSDVPCLITIHFQVINNQLYMQTIMRSQDLLLAFHSNLLAFCKLGHLVSKEVGVPFKRLLHYVMNLHIYVERDKDYVETYFGNIQ